MLSCVHDVCTAIGEIRQSFEISRNFNRFELQMRQIVYLSTECSPYCKSVIDSINELDINSTSLQNFVAGNGVQLVHDHESPVVLHSQ
jgi:hypothetical protein